VAKDKKKSRNTGNYIELLGNYDSKTKKLNIEKEKIEK
jgi:ribosomal protein S16